jgi:hypothetical protein
MPKMHFVVSPESDPVDAYAEIFHDGSDIPTTTAHYISIRNHDSSESLRIAGMPDTDMATNGQLLPPGGQYDLNVPAGVRIGFVGDEGAGNADVYVIMGLAG